MSPRIHRVVGCYGWVSPRLSGLRLSKHTNRPPSLLLLRGTAWVYPSVESAVEGRREGRREREIGEERTWTTTRRPLGRGDERKEEKMENGGRGMGEDESVGDVRMC